MIGVFAFIFKSWITKLIEANIDRQFEKRKLELEVEKKQAFNNLEQINSIYPEILELTYRLRNRLRDMIEHFETGNLLNAYENPHLASKLSSDLKNFGDEVGVFTERLYKYKAFVESETFSNLHSFKRNLQNAGTIIDKLTRGDIMWKSEEGIAELENETGMGLEEIISISIDKLKSIYESSNSLFEKIDKDVKNKLKIE